MVTTRQAMPLIADEPEKGKDTGFLNFETYAMGFARSICHLDTPGPLTIAIDGRWGSGKSTFMNAVVHACEELQSHHQFVRIIPIHVNAWDHEKTGATALSLLEQISQNLQDEVGKDKATRKLLVDFAKKAFDVVGLPLMERVGSLVGLKFDRIVDDLRQGMAELSKLKPDFRECIVHVVASARKKTSRPARVLITIDDLDRVQEDRLMEVIEVLKLVLQVPDCVFLLAADLRRVERIVEKRYLTASLPTASPESTLGKEYLEKLFQVRFELPQPRTPDIVTFLHEAPACRGLGKAMAPYILAAGMNNPRRIKRLLATYALNHEILTVKQDANAKGASKKNAAGLALQLLPAWTVLRSVRPRFVALLERSFEGDDFEQNVLDWYIRIANTSVDKRTEAMRNLIGQNADSPRWIWEEFVHDPPLMNVLAKMERPVAHPLDQLRGAVQDLGLMVPPEEIQSDLSGQVLRGRDLTTFSSPKVDAIGTDFTHATLIGFNGQGGKFLRSNFDNCTLTGAILTGANFVGASLRRAKLEGAQCDRATFLRADVCGAVFKGASLVNATFAGALVRGAQFHNADLTRASFRDIVEVDDTFMEGVAASPTWRDADFEPGVYNQIAQIADAKQPDRRREGGR